MSENLPQNWHVELQQDIAVGPQLHKLLRERIIHNQLEAGARLSEAEVASLFAVSRQPVREAFIKLAEEGLVEVRPQRGTFVKRISLGSVHDARFLREAIESDIVCLLARKRPDALIAELRSQLKDQRRVAGKEPDRFIDLDERFHRTLAEAAGKTGVWDFIEGLKIQMDRVRYLSLFRFPMQKLIAQHKAIVDAIERHDEGRSEAAMRQHLRTILDDLNVIAEEKPDLFEASVSPDS